MEFRKIMFYRGAGWVHPITDSTFLFYRCAEDEKEYKDKFSEKERYGHPFPNYEMKDKEILKVFIELLEKHTIKKPTSGRYHMYVVPLDILKEHNLIDEEGHFRDVTVVYKENGSSL